MLKEFMAQNPISDGISDDSLICREKNEVIPGLNIGFVEFPLEIRQRFHLVNKRSDTGEIDSG